MNNEDYYDFCEQAARDEARAEREWKRRKERGDFDGEPICSTDEEE